MQKEKQDPTNNGSQTPLIGIRVDATARIGIGHATRCMAIAKALSNIGCDVLFIVSCKESTLPFIERGFECFVIDADEKKLEPSDADRLYNLCLSRGIECLLIDSYGATKSFMKRLQILFDGVIKTAFLDDMFTYEAGASERPQIYEVDIVIGGDPFFEENWYRNAYHDKRTELLIGSQYIPIRSDLPASKDFASSCSQVKKIMITTGSTNPDRILERMTKLALEALQGTDIEIHVVVGSKSSFELEAQNLYIHQGDSITEVMEQCQIAFSSAGITLLELIALKMPTLAISIVDNQRATVEAFKKLELGLGCDSSDSNEHIKELLKHLSDNASLRTLFSDHCYSMIDRRGAERIALRLLDCTEYI